MSRTLTENKAPTFDSSSDPRVDFFFHVIEDASNDKTIDLLAKSWDCHPLDTLKLIAVLRDCRKGKGIRSQYHMCMYWLFGNHYKTLMANIEQMLEFGYYKDLLHILMIVLFDGLIPDYMAKDDGGAKKEVVGNTRGRQQRATKRKLTPNNHSFPLYDRLVLRSLRKERQQMKDSKKSKNGDKALIDDTSVEQLMDNQPEVETNEVYLTVPTRAEAQQQSRKHFAEKRFKCDEKYRNLYQKIVSIFANQLNTDLEKMSKEVKTISLAGKWAPTNGHHFDKYLSISQPIARELSQLMSRDDVIKDPKLLITFYQKEVCAPIRRYLKIPEVFMSSKLWSEVQYNRVASKCMQKNKSLFIKYDEQRFGEYLASKKTISGAVLKPVEMVERGFKIINRKIAEINESIIRGNESNNTDATEDIAEPVLNAQTKMEIEVLEKQWLSMCEEIKKNGGGLFGNVIAVCDVSGSMNGIPMNAAIGLTILVMYLSENPWNSLCITFHERPEMHFIDSNMPFIEKLEDLSKMAWGGNTNLNLVFKTILDKAVEQRLTNEELPKLLIIFTDMEFDEAFRSPSLTNFESAKQMFETNGYNLPPIVFWNLRSNTTLTSTPVQFNQLGAALLSGYSGQLLSLLLKMKDKDLEKINPYSLMRSAIDSNRYSKLQIID